MLGIRDGGDGRTFIRHDQKPDRAVVPRAIAKILLAYFRAGTKVVEEGGQGGDESRQVASVSVDVAKGLMKISPIVFIPERASRGRRRGNELLSVYRFYNINYFISDARDGNSPGTALSLGSSFLSRSIMVHPVASPRN